MPGGSNNEALSGNDIVGGGYNNTASGGSAAVMSGYENTASGGTSFIGGGNNNNATNTNVTIAGGNQNNASGYISTIAGGLFNNASGQFAAVPGGRNNSAGGDNSFAAGSYMQLSSEADGTFVFGQHSSDVDITQANAFLIFPAGTAGKTGIGTTEPTATLDVNGTTGYDQVRMRQSYTPTGSADSNGNTGDIAWDDDHLYVKVSSGWKRASLEAF
ncbi:hypothetical protein ACFL4J_01285 [Candidatus Margulisiibacteriota bacterium]